MQTPGEGGRGKNRTRHSSTNLINYCIEKIIGKLVMRDVGH